MSLSRIPAERLLPHIERYLAEYETQEGYGVQRMEPKTCLAFHARMKVDTLSKILNRRTKTLDFNMADRLLCAMNRPQLWWEDLADLYYSVDLSAPITAPIPAKEGRICARAGCSNAFVPKMPWGRYCSTACRASVQRARRQQRRGVTQRYGTRYGTCPKGHDRSPENVYVRPDGHVSCRVCNRDAERRRYRQDEKYRQRRILRERERRVQLKVAA